MRPSNFDARFFRDALSGFVTGVTVLAARDAHQHLVGVTINSFNSVSLEPPLVLWSLSKTSRHLSTFQRAPRYSINVLSEGQQAISQTFARRRTDLSEALWTSPFSGVAHHLSEVGLPIIDRHCGWFECLNRQQYDEGDHVIFIGLVERCAAQPGEKPLAYFNGNYRRLAQEKTTPQNPGTEY